MPEHPAEGAGQARADVVAEQIERRGLALGAQGAAPDPAARHRVRAEEAEGEQQQAGEHQRDRLEQGQQQAAEHQQDDRPEHLASPQLVGQRTDPGRAVDAREVNHREHADHRLAHVVGLGQQAVADVVEQGDEAAHQQEADQEQPGQSGVAQQDDRPEHLASPQLVGQRTDPGRAVDAREVNHREHADHRLAHVVGLGQQAVADVVEQGDEAAHQQEADQEQPGQSGRTALVWRRLCRPGSLAGNPRLSGSGADSAECARPGAGRAAVGAIGRTDRSTLLVGVKAPGDRRLELSGRAAPGCCQAGPAGAPGAARPIPRPPAASR